MAFLLFVYLNHILCIFDGPGQKVSTELIRKIRKAMAFDEILVFDISYGGFNVVETAHTLKDKFAFLCGFDVSHMADIVPKIDGVNGAVCIFVLLISQTAQKTDAVVAVLHYPVDVR